MKTTIRLSNLLFKKYPNSANKLTDILDKHKISFEKLENTKDIWTRDYMPICLDDGTLVSYIYEPDYLKDEEYKNTRTQIKYEKNHLAVGDLFHPNFRPNAQRPIEKGSYYCNKQLSS